MIDVDTAVRNREDVVPNDRPPVGLERAVSLRRESLTIKWTADVDCGAVAKTASVGRFASPCDVPVNGRTLNQEMLYRRRIKAERNHIAAKFLQPNSACCFWRAEHPSADPGVRHRKTKPAELSCGFLKSIGRTLHSHRACIQNMRVDHAGPKARIREQLLIARMSHQVPAPAKRCRKSWRRA